MIQKIRLGSDGTIVTKRMQPYVKGQASHTPSLGLSRLKRLLSTKEPHICVVRGEGIGDVIMTLPTVAALKQTFKDTRLTYATNTRYLDGALVKVLKYNPDINEIIERDLIDDSKYDLVINLHCPCIAYEKQGMPPINRIDIFARHAGVDLTDTRPRYNIQKQEIEVGRQYVEALQGRKVILVQPSASNSRRSLDHGKLKAALTALATHHNTVNLILTHGSDFQTDVLWDNIPNSMTIKNLDIRQIGGLMIHCDLVLCQDSSVLHLAGALDVPTVSLFGPTHPAARINHYPRAVAIWKGKDFAPCPCWYNGGCAIGEACWASIRPDDIVEACVKHLHSTEKVNISQLVKKSSAVTISTEVI